MGRQIISTEFAGKRFVAVGNSVNWRDAKKWVTFHEFLFDNLKNTLTLEWGRQQQLKPVKDQHPILQWFSLVGEYLKKHEESGRKVQSAPMTGAVFALLSLAYNLYLLKHNVEVQDQLVRRLKDRKQFLGALYETYVAAILIKAGFALRFENEQDGSRTHCEFTATSPQTGKSYSVEAKSREANKTHFAIGNQLYEALGKVATGERVVFVNVNVPNLFNGQEAIIQELKKKEETLTIEGNPAAPAYIFVTNYSFPYNLDSTSYEQAALAHGFKISDFRLDSKFSNLREARISRERHKDMWLVMQSLRDYREIPSTFDGEIPEFAFNPELQKNRLIIGGKYLLSGEDGEDVVGVLVTATVSEGEKKAYGVYRLENGKQVIYTCPLVEEELLAYRNHPDTFFGVPLRQGMKIKDPLELFDFFYENYKVSPREKLEEFLQARKDLGDLNRLSREELLVACCEGWVYSAMNRN